MPTLKMPDYRGKFDGQCVTIDVRRPKRKNGRAVRFPWNAPSGKTVWMTVKETQCSVEWVWDGFTREWVTRDVWNSRRRSA